ncbi:MAG: DUF2809 domain-containing protein [Proteobacteria bacterium]|nr:DUF2809 domain-containing protein [Pseudomonadota bacterium]
MECGALVLRIFDVTWAARRRYVILGFAAVVLGASVVLYRRLGGPGSALVRGHVGDVAATMLVYAVVSLAWRASPWARGVGTFAFAAAIECVPLVWHAPGNVSGFLVGTQFDLLDLVAYALGVVIAVVSTSPRRPRPGAPRAR